MNNELKKIIPVYLLLLFVIFAPTSSLAQEATEQHSQLREGIEKTEEKILGSETHAKLEVSENSFHTKLRDNVIPMSVALIIALAGLVTWASKRRTNRV